MGDTQKNNKEELIPSPERQRKIRNRIGLIFFCCILIVTLLAFNYYQQGLKDWGSIDFNLNIFLLINLNILLLVTVILLIIRNLVKLVYERKRRILGFRLKFKLTLAFVLVSSLPMLMFFFIANGLLKDSLDFWFKGQFAVALKDSAMMVDRLNQYQTEDLKHFVKIVADDYQENIGTQPFGDKAKQPPKEWFDNVLSRYRLDGIIWYDADLIPGSRWFLDTGKRDAWSPLVKNDIIDKSAVFPVDFDSRTMNGKINRALMPIQLEGKTFFLEVAKLQTGSNYEDLAVIQQNLENFQNLSRLQSPIRTNFTTYLLLFTVLIIFGGIWFGYYLAGGIVKPIETLVEGTRRISKGDLDFQIDLQMDDETGMLLDSFNAMTKELLQNRKKLAISREALVYTNKTLEERNIFVELVQQNIQTGIFSVDNSGYINGVNPYMIKLFQIRPAEVTQKHYLSVLTKEHHLFEIINNLVKNALEAINNDGLLLVLASSIEDKVVITIQDTGQGIQADTRDKIFSPFFTTKKEGTGIGLAVVKKLVEEYFGTVDVRSVVDKGTTFIISFPVESEGAEHGE